MTKYLALHDAIFNGILLDGKHSCVLHFTHEDGSTCVVSLNGLRELLLNEFRQGNIVSEFQIVSGEAVPSNIDPRRLFVAPHASADETYHAKFRAFCDARIAAIESGALTLVEITSVSCDYGADLIAICEEVRL